MLKLLKIIFIWIPLFCILVGVIVLGVNYYRFKQALGPEPDLQEVEKILAQVKPYFAKKMPPDAENRLVAYKNLSEAIKNNVDDERDEAVDNILGDYSLYSGHYDSADANDYFLLLRQNEALYQNIKTISKLSQSELSIMDPAEGGGVSAISFNIGQNIERLTALSDLSRFTLAYCHVLVRDLKWQEAGACFELDTKLIKDMFAAPIDALNILLSVNQLENHIKNLSAMLQMQVTLGVAASLTDQLLLDFLNDSRGWTTLNNKKLVRQILLRASYSAYYFTIGAVDDVSDLMAANGMNSEIFKFVPLYVLQQKFSFDKKYIAKDLLEINEVLQRPGFSFNEADRTELSRILSVVPRPLEMVWKNMRLHLQKNLSQKEIVLSDVYAVGIKLVFAIHEYHSKNGTYPDLLNGISNNFFNSTDKANYDNLNFIYHKTENGYGLYHLGLNGNDDGGREESDECETCDDIVLASPVVVK